MNPQKEWVVLDSDIQIDAIGRVNETNRHPERQGVPYWILVLVEKGQRTLYADFQPLEIGAHQFFLLPPNTHQMPMERDDHTAFYVHFYAKGEKCDAPVRVNAEQIILPTYGHLPTDPDCLSHMRYLCAHALTPYSSQKFLLEQFKSLLTVLSLECQRNPYPEERKGLCMDSLSDFIKENACRPLRAEDYETKFGKSYHHINLLFKRYFGATVKQYHMHVRMQYAAQMLLSGASLQETAARCGFDDYYFFINSFTKDHGIPPAAYRKRNGG